MPTNFEDIIFNESNHAYTLYGQPLSSVTQVIARLKPPFDNLPNCELSIYSLQTSLNRLIIERNGGEVESCTIVHLNNEGQITPYQAMDLRDQLFTWLTARSSSNAQ